ncbi:MAG: hypothetical protein RR987_16520 [Hafnia sp.]|uniref:hypothetical protein n=1 Tax=Hafnia sp. TaxID=1873498 RepID=UPI002FCB0080
MDAIEKINALLDQEQKTLKALTSTQRSWAETYRILVTDTEFLERHMRGNGICTSTYWIARELLMTTLLAEATDRAEVPGDVPVFGTDEN